MRPRQTLLEQFSTFLEFEGDRSSRWATEPRLHRSMQTKLATNAPTHNLANPEDDRFWSLYWHKLWATESSRLATNHLTAYLQETCYWAASRMLSQFPNTQQTLADGFQLASMAVPKVLKGFSPQQGFALLNYGSAIFSSSLRDHLRQQQEVDICTPWSLLRKTSQKRMVEALQAAGLAPQNVEAHLLAWNCFKQQYQPTTATGSRRLEKPSEAVWSAIAIQFNLEHRASPHLTPDKLESWLNVCAQAARRYLTPDVVSINAPKPGQEAKEWLDDVADMAGGDSLLSEMIVQEEVQERRDRQAEVSETLTEAIAKLEPELQQILQLYYSGRLTQQEIATQLGIKQYTISRRLTRAKELVLKKLAQWTQDSLHIVITPDLLQNMSSLLEDWLHQTYHRP
jgi:RNA polymerase sigma factor (sigma-70 family)